MEIVKNIRVRFAFIYFEIKTEFSFSLRIITNNWMMRSSSNMVGDSGQQKVSETKTPPDRFSFIFANSLMSFPK